MHKESRKPLGNIPCQCPEVLHREEEVPKPQASSRMVGSSGPMPLSKQDTKWPSLVTKL